MITGAAGFVGHHLSLRLLRQGMDVLGIDNLDPYYNPSLKRARLKRVSDHEAFRFKEADVADGARLLGIMETFRPDAVVHLAARAGVRNPSGDLWAYARPNLDGFVSMLDACRYVRPRHIVYASSSSVYGADSSIPFREDDRADRPASFYAATKRSNELMAEAFSALEGIACTGLRFFTLYGPWGRPDMAYYSFTREILAGRPITLYDADVMRRDFTYIDDAVEAVTRLVNRSAGDPQTAASAGHRIYNIGNTHPVALGDFVATLETLLGRKAAITHRQRQPGEMTVTFADTTRLREAVGFVPSTDLRDGLSSFVRWYRSYHDAPAMTSG
nr:NAD-dependent epimerase/dehydratase family protein [Aureimonas phyllosphaerae]